MEVRLISAFVCLTVTGLGTLCWRRTVARNAARIAPLTADRTSIALYIHQPGPLGLAGQAALTAPEVGFRVVGNYNGSSAMAAGVREGDILHSVSADGHNHEVVAWPTYDIVTLLRGELPRPLRLTVLRSLEQPAAFAAARSTV